MTTQTSFHLHAEFQHSLHQINVQPVGLQGWGSARAKGVGVYITRHCSSLTPMLRVMGGSSRAGWSLIKRVQIEPLTRSCATPNTQKLYVRYLTPQSPGWGRGEVGFKAGSWCRVSAACGSWFNPLQNMNGGSGKCCPLPNGRTGGWGGGGRQKWV